MRDLPFTLLGIAIVAVMTSCSSMPPPVPVVGQPHAVAALAGTWSGEYRGREPGRHGLISLTLAARSDTAHGEILMLPQRAPGSFSSHGTHAAPPRNPRSLEIAFVAISRDLVYGYLDPYDDPECECTLVTRFWGRVQGDRIDGQYQSFRLGTHESTTGEWWAHRAPALP